MPHESTRMINRITIILLSVVLISCASSTGNGNKKDNTSADVYLQLGIRYLSLNKLEVAKENLQQALKKDPDNTQVHNALAFLYEKINEYDLARDHYEIALKHTPNDLGVQNNFGRFLCERGEFEKGMALLTQAISTPLNDRQWLALTNAGRCQLGMGQKQKAKAYFKRALQLNDAYAPALQAMQKISYESGEFWAAKGYLERYLRVASHTPESLGLAMKTERALGNTEIANEYQNLLLEKFPLSDEAKHIKPALQ
ncbi:MAG: type IV pilus biogenesis/stability protein PilW [Methylobacter sp.]